MIYNKLINLLDEKNLKVKPFFESLGFSSSYIYKARLADSIKVKDLEIISKKLGISMSYWFEDDKNEFNEKTVEYMEMTKSTVDELQKDLKYFRERCESLEKENQKLKGNNPGKGKIAI